MTANYIDGSNYFKLRDMATILDVRVWFDTAANTVRIEPDRKYDPNCNGSTNEAIILILRRLDRCKKNT